MLKKQSYESIDFKSKEKMISSLSLLILNILPNYIEIPVGFQLFVSSLACVVLGCIIGARFKERTGQIQQDKDNIQEKIQQKDAYMFPVYGSGSLFGLYLLIKYTNKDLLGYLMQGYFSLIGLFCLMQIIQGFMPQSIISLKDKFIVKKNINFNIIQEIKFDILISQMDILTAVISFIPVYFYLTTGHWNLNNLFGLSFSITGIDSIALPNFRIGFILLWGLFFYDIFWVYGTDVMITVAKNLNAPIKLLFPIDLLADPPKLSLLGLGDIVIPGIFVALCLKYDIDVFIKQKEGALKTPYFNACIIGYALGIVVTYCTMLFMNQGQPALLFLVPGCCGAVLITAFFKNDINNVFIYEETKNSDEDTKKME